MRLSPQLTIICSSMLALCFSSCGGPNGVRITEGHQEPTASAPVSSKKTRAHIVHIDLFERIATIRHGMPLGGEFLIGYGIVRIFGEFFREPDATLILGLSRGQFYSIFMIIAGAAIIRIARCKAAAATKA